MMARDGNKSVVEKHATEIIQTVVDLMETVSCFQELCMMVNLNGIEVDDLFLQVFVQMATDKFNWNKHLNDKEYSEVCGKYITFMNEMINETDVLSNACVKDISTEICSMILNSWHKDSVIGIFKSMCLKYPNEMKTEYKRQKQFMRYSV